MATRPTRKGGKEVKTYQILLTKHAINITNRNVQAEHGLITEIFNDPDPQWVRPRRSVIIARANKAPKRLDGYTREINELPDHQIVGTNIEFAFIGHPIKRNGNNEIPLDGKDAEAWAINQLSDAIHVSTIATERLAPRKGTRWGKHMTFHAYAFNGHGEIINQTAFNNLMDNGVGRAKAYGFGMLIIK